MSETNFLVIPAEGDSVETEFWYTEELEKHYKGCFVEIFRYNGNHDIRRGVKDSIRDFFSKRWWQQTTFEVHAQGGFGAYVAYAMLRMYPKRVERVFFVGGAPSNAMMPIQRFFHRYLSKIWYYSPIPYFADDPNPFLDGTIVKIKASSTAAMRRDPLLYRNQLVHLGRWRLAKGWRVPKSCAAYFVPNGDTLRPKWWDNSFDNRLAGQIWQDAGVYSTKKPGEYFSFYSMMPADALFAVMDGARQFYE